MPVIPSLSQIAPAQTHARSSRLMKGAATIISLVTDGRWIYRRIVGSDRRHGHCGVFDLRADRGATAEHHAAVNFLAPIDSRALLYVSRAEDWSGPWLWARRSEQGPHRVSSGPDRYISGAVATASCRRHRRQSTASLWTKCRFSIGSSRSRRPAVSGDNGAGTGAVTLAKSLFYLSAAKLGTAWRFRDGGRPKSGRARTGRCRSRLVSPDGGGVAVVVRQEEAASTICRRTMRQTLAASLDMQGEAGQATAD
jgi:hypothetical protein